MPHLLPCLFKSITGLSCPGCGIQRSFLLLLNGDIAASFRSNMFLWVMMPVILLAIISTLYPSRMPHLYRFFRQRATLIGLIVVTFLWTAARNLLAL